MQKITHCLWFDTQAEAAATFYVSLFKHGKIKGDEKYAKAAEEVSGKPAGSVMVVNFEIEGQEFMALNGGPAFKFNEAVSFVINCDGQAEVDYFWEALTADGGQEQPCGWLKDKFGLSWQVVPVQFTQIMKKNPEKVMAAMLKMKKLVIKDLEAAAS